MKSVFMVLCVSVMMCAHVLTACAESEVKVNNILENIPYQEEGIGKRKLVDETYLCRLNLPQLHRYGL